MKLKLFYLSVCLFIITSTNIMIAQNIPPGLRKGFLYDNPSRHQLISTNIMNAQNIPPGLRKGFLYDNPSRHQSPYKQPENQWKKHGKVLKLIPVGGGYAQDSTIVGKHKQTKSSHDSGNMKIEEETFIHWGQDTLPSSHPYMVTLQVYRDDPNKQRQHIETQQCNDTWLQTTPDWFHICGGALIAEDMVLTAAHCVDWITDDQIENLRVGLGWWDLSQGENGTGHQVRGIKSIAIHPGYTESNSIFLPTDTAILALNRSADLIPGEVATISLQKFKWTREKGKCTVAGWGETQCGAPNILQSIPADVLTYGECKNAWAFLGSLTNRSYPVYKSEICTLSWTLAGDKDSCYGDSGSALVCGGSVAGVVSWGDGECQGCRPAVYGRVSYMYKWYKNTMKKLRQQ